MDPVGVGMVLGLVNVVLIAVGIEAMNEDTIRIGGAVFAYGVFPGVFTGAFVGAIAGRTRAWPRWLRCIVMPAPAIAVVIGLGWFFRVEEYVVPSLVPTLAAAWWLERHARDGAEVVPAARAIAGGAPRRCQPSSSARV
jgi:hypothetical protein